MKKNETKIEIKSHLEKMKKFNQWEEDQDRNLTPDENLERFFALMEFGYQIYSKEQIESFRKKKLASLIEINKKLRKIKKFLNWQSFPTRDSPRVGSD